MQPFTSSTSATPTRPVATPSLLRYRRHLEATARWIVSSVRAGNGGSSAVFSAAGGWSRPYPETTGYLVPTAIALEAELPGIVRAGTAVALGEWLLQIQRDDGAWSAGLHPPRGASRASVFNTGQVMKGLVALHDHTSDPRWIQAASRALAWLEAGQQGDGLWSTRDYRDEGTPSYYTEVLAPMIEVARRAGGEDVARVRTGLDTVCGRMLPSGAFARWGFSADAPAFTHTIGYTLRGIIDCANLLGAWHEYRGFVVPALEVLMRRSELAAGALPGAFDEQWRRRGKFVCLTGNAQVALCILAWEEHEPDLRLVSAAARMIDYVCLAQRLRGPSGVRGGVAGSAPLWGPYMRMRLPNWAAKYHCDALLSISARIVREILAA